MLAPTNHPLQQPADDVLAAMATAVTVVDLDGRLAFVNAACETLFKNSRSKLLGRKLGQILNDCEDLERLCQRTRDTDVTVVHREFQVRPLSTAQVKVSVDVVASPYASGQVLLELHDTELQVRIERENRMLTQRGVSRAMARQLAHEIKNPLGGLRGAAQLLARRLDGEPLREFTDVIIREADRLVTLVDTMLGPSGPTRYEQCNIHRLLDHVRRLIVAEAGAEVAVVDDYDPSLPAITLDEDRVIQALLNVARNALQAVEPRGTITFRTRAVTGFTIADVRHALVLRVDIEDSGPGVADDLREKIFYPLVTSRTQGTGLGLTVAQDLISRHDGIIRLRAGQPTTFSLFLPYVRRPTDAGVTAT